MKAQKVLLMLPPCKLSVSSKIPHRLESRERFRTHFFSLPDPLRLQLDLRHWSKHGFYGQHWTPGYGHLSPTDFVLRRCVTDGIALRSSQEFVVFDSCIFFFFRLFCITRTYGATRCPNIYSTQVWRIEWTTQGCQSDNILRQADFCTKLFEFSVHFTFFLLFLNEEILDVVNLLADRIFIY